MIFARDKSQMCNNLLQYAHVYAWGREHGRKVISMRFSYKYKFFKISHSNLVSFPLYLFAKYMAALKLLPTASFKHEDCNREALEQMMLSHRNIVVSGWNVRFYDLFLKYRSDICDLFTIDREYILPVEKQMLPKTDGVIRLGVHIRRGDYAQWKDGIYYYNNKVYEDYINSFRDMFPGKEVHVYLSTNDSSIDEKEFRTECKTPYIFNLKGHPASDLYMLSLCDYLIGPPSTFSLVAAMYRDIPLYRMDESSTKNFTKESFHLFDYWFRRIL